MVDSVYNPSYSGYKGRMIMTLRPTWKKVVRPYLKSKTKNPKRIKGITKVDYLVSTTVLKILLA
jgi:hypothetical protein